MRLTQLLNEPEADDFISAINQYDHNYHVTDDMHTVIFEFLHGQVIVSFILPFDVKYTTIQTRCGSFSHCGVIGSISNLLEILKDMSGIEQEQEQFDLGMKIMFKQSVCT